jgi:hypothetical protein
MRIKRAKQVGVQNRSRCPPSLIRRAPIFAPDAEHLQDVLDRDSVVQGAIGGQDVALSQRGHSYSLPNFSRHVGRCVEGQCARGIDVAGDAKTPAILLPMWLLGYPVQAQ